MGAQLSFQAKKKNYFICIFLLFTNFVIACLDQVKSTFPRENLGVGKNILLYFYLYLTCGFTTGSCFIDLALLWPVWASIFSFVKWGSRIKKISQIVHPSWVLYFYFSSTFFLYHRVHWPSLSLTTQVGAFFEMEYYCQVCFKVRNLSTKHWIIVLMLIMTIIQQPCLMLNKWHEIYNIMSTHITILGNM